MEHTHTNKIVYIAIGVVGIIILLFIMKHFMQTESGGAPAVDGRSLEEQMTATGPSTLKPEEEARLREQMTATGPSTISEADMAKLRESMRAQN